MATKDTKITKTELLQIYREPLKPGSEAAYSVVEENTACVATALGCPHPYLGAESLTGPKVAWWFNAFESSEQQQKVYADYGGNTELMAVLQANGRKKAALVQNPVDVVARYRPDLSDGIPWRVGRGRFLVITTTKDDVRVGGTAFEAPDGTRFIVIATTTRQEADAAHAASHESTILAVRPSWSFPARDWIEADPLFWN